MTQPITKPGTRPASPLFSSGPCAKRPGWSLDALADANIGQSHRAKGPKAKLQRVIEDSRAILGIPEEYRIGIVPGSDTGAFEMAMWSVLGARPIDILAWESFGQGWVTDVVDHLKIDDVRVLDAEYGALPDLDAVDFARDVVFTWNGTTSGVRVPNANWIPEDRAGLTLCDATSAAFAMELPWSKLDIVTWSWQKVLGGEAQHGMLVLSPRAVERLDSYEPPWPMPKIFRLTKGGKLNEDIFRGSTINTPSMICVEDHLDALDWSRDIGGIDALIGRSNENFGVIDTWISQSGWAAFLADDPALRSTTSVCLKIVDEWFTALSLDEQAAIAKAVAGLLDTEGVAYDIGGYRDAPPGLRIWAGATVEKSDLATLMPWLDWAFETVKAGRTQP
ncbi:MAG: phosphoserine transaminase [Alphaproteobacteria bacterium]|nr:phosphoserine transaminase [Alphaproteobacteria bacterium]